MKTIIIKKTIITGIIAAIFGAIYYIALPAINLSSIGFWFFIIVEMGVMAIANYLQEDFDCEDEGVTMSKILAGLVAFAVAALIIVSCVGAKMFNAKKYSAVRPITTADSAFSEYVPEANKDTVITVDLDTAEKIGARKLGTLTEYVSQYKIGAYTQISKNGQSYRVAPLEFASVFKWSNNHKLPGYIMVDTHTGDANFVECEMVVSPSGYFGENLRRMVRSEYATTIFGTFSFEVDDEGHPYFIAPVYKYTIGAMGGKDVSGIILVDATTAEIQKIDIASVPEWVDHVYDGFITCSQISDSFQYQNGFWNSIIGQKNVSTVTKGYGYIVKDNDVFLYTGITSAISTDESNLGFVLANMRTGETTYIVCPSAEEYSAMDTSKGVVQEKGYDASFPVLLNLNGRPVYFLTLKDSAGLVKAYSLVDAQDYTKVVVSDTLESVWKKFSDTVSSSIIADESTEFAEVVITNIIPVVVDGNTVYYITVDGRDDILTANIQISKTLPFIQSGDTVTIETVGSVIVSIN